MDLTEQNQSGEMISFGIIASAGHARSVAMQAVSAARKGDFESARRMLDEAKQAGLEAHLAQTALLTREASGDHVPVDVMLVHAQDHLMTSLLAQEMAEELVHLYECKHDRNESQDV
ncbi:phosphotransferase system PTS lactose/cellobiose-specific IIA subunit [Coriobacterium glomerans PW2]|uniref:Phosphotransferase system PTS lactose/cellobiose-specific IIA subunit n=1 Tax=Coriobacterium glomerans (strain ATCC 49209 / DSM 20642 / JCM 10262 / PW2) TaxID=700015 RepID=F2N8U6_CORGP|nr:PTS lactose/cellobiose transporter subunit IIA [Coriobacterium glomerans]AEB07546.1 phosphotransferase system PTS lactose/cellobiose-specific IIA subunit [Coriobacterium glomerans PW2]